MYKNLFVIFLLQTITNIFAIVNLLNVENYNLISQNHNMQSKSEHSHDIISKNETDKFLRNSIAEENNYKTEFKSLVCSVFPNVCSKFQNFWKGSFQQDVSEARGAKDLIAIVSTMLATLLGAMLVKINVLIVLSVLSLGIGKLLLVILTLKSQIFSHNTHHPTVYDKFYHPHHKEYPIQLSDSYQEEYPTYSLPK